MSQWLQVTLSSIGDAVITTDTEGKISFLNPVAQAGHDCIERPIYFLDVARYNKARRVF